MKKYISFCASLLAIAALTACSDTFEPETSGDGEGRLMLKATINSDVVVKSRAGQTNDELAAKTKIWISNSKGVVKKFNSYNEVPSTGIMLLSGSYVAEAWAGDSVSASWDKRYFTGRKEFAIAKGASAAVNIECKIANTLVSVEYEDAVKNLLNDITLEVGHDKATGTREGTLTFDSSTPEGAKAYFMTNSRSKSLVYTLRGTLASNGQAFEYKGVLENVARATEYHLTVKHTDQAPDEVGGAWITIVVDEEEVEVAESYEIASAPAISLINGDLNTPVSGMVGQLPRTSLWIAAVAELAEVEVRSEALAGIADLGGSDFEVFAMSDRVREALNGAGINWVYTTHEDTGFAELKLNFEAEFLNSLSEGDYTFTVLATDRNGRTATATFRVIPTMAKVMVNDIDPNAMTTTSRSAVVSGVVMRDDAVNYGIQYRVKGTQQWTKVAANTAAAPARGISRAAGDVYTVELTGLQPATVYQTAAYCDGFESTVIAEFTTEGEPQLPNSSFEEWSTASDKALMPSGDPNNFYWDSGNHGSITMNKNITSQSADYAHSGSSSVKLESQKVGVMGIGKFAAGNIFIGKYLATDGTDGVLGWGRPFTARPKALRVWVKYNPAVVSDANSANPDGVAKGEMDKGIIYIALMDGTTNSYNSEKWPVVIKTKASERTLFAAYDKQVIAYGEHVFEGATSGDGLVEVIIPLDYRRTDIRPSNIVMVASASKMGDYFTGGPSVMYLDDVELIYE